MRYRPPYASERLLPQTEHGYTGCRISSHWHGVALATLGESTFTDKGRLKGKAARRRDLMRGWEGTGDKSRAGYNQSHVPGISQAMFPDLPVPDIRQTRDWGDVTDLLEDNAISIAVRISVLPQDQTVDPFTRADHQVCLYRPRQGVVKSIGPMRPQSSTYTGHPVKLGEVRKGAEAILDGLIVYEVYPIGAWTREALSTTKMRKRLRAARNARDDALEQVGTLTVEVESLRTELQECRDSGGRDAGWESALIHIKEAADRLRQEGPPL